MKQPILMRHLFTMSAGLDYDLDSQIIRDLKAATDGRCPTLELAKALAKQPLAFEPGTHFLYSLCHDVLAAVVEVISGMRFSDYVKANIFDPLGMTRSCYHVAPGTEDQYAVQYWFDDDEHIAKPISLNNIFVFGSEHDSGGAGMISSVEEYAKFTDALACEEIGATGEQILSASTIELMRTNFLNPTQLADFNWPQVGGYGYGLGVRTMIDRTGSGGSLSPIGEFGWAGADGEYFLMDPAKRLSLFYGQHLWNSKEPYVHPRLRNITYTCLDKI